MHIPRFESPGFAVKALDNQIKRYFISHTDSCGEICRLTGMQKAVVGYLGDRQGENVFQRDLENAFNMRRSTATGILKLMVKNGLLRKEPVDYDARLKKLILTERALDLRHEAREKINLLDKLLTDGIQDKELKVFYSVINRMIKNIADISRK